MRLLWLADVLRGAGCDVVELDGWHTRGRELDVAYGVVVHDTVTTTGWSDAAVERLLVNGKSGTPGPLYQLGLTRAGQFRVLASGRANHAGFSKPWGNSSIGIGVYCAGGLAGREEPWNDAQYQAICRGVPAILDRLGMGRSGHFNPRVAGHKEIDTRGKVDPYAIDMDRLRRDVDQPSPEGRTVTAKRIGGGTRHGTALLLARTRWQDETGGVVFLVNPATSDAAAVANVSSMGRILTVDKDDLPAETRKELGRVKPDEVIAVGGTNAVSNKVLEQARKAAV